MITYFISYSNSALNSVIFSVIWGIAITKLVPTVRLFVLDHCFIGFTFI